MLFQDDTEGTKRGELEKVCGGGLGNWDWAKEGSDEDGDW